MNVLLHFVVLTSKRSRSRDANHDHLTPSRLWAKVWWVVWQCPLSSPTHWNPFCIKPDRIIVSSCLPSVHICFWALLFIFPQLKLFPLDSPQKAPFTEPLLNPQYKLFESTDMEQCLTWGRERGTEERQREERRVRIPALKWRTSQQSQFFNLSSATYYVTLSKFCMTLDISFCICRD